MMNYGQVGVNVGPVGRWTRFVLGILMIVGVAMHLYTVTDRLDITFYPLMVLSFGTILGVYTLGHVLIGDKLSGKSPWWGTLIFVAPAMFLGSAPFFNPSLQIGYWLNLPVLNHPFLIGLYLYFGISLFFQWQAKYGGCEVVTIPNFLFNKKYGSYCVPLLPLDVLEKVIVDKVGNRHSLAGGS